MASTLLPGLFIHSVAAAVSQSVVIILCIYNITLQMYTVTFQDWRNRIIIIIIIMIFPRPRVPVAFFLFSLLFIAYLHCVPIGTL